MKDLARFILFAALAPAANSQSILYTFNGDSSDDATFGASLNSAGDVNGDGFADLIVGTWADDNNGTNSGSARVFSGLDGTVLYTFDGDSAGDWLGYSVSGAGDVNGDGFADVIVGAHGDDKNGTNSGSARVLSGADGSVLHTFYGNKNKASLGAAVDGAGDVNGDGFDDLIVGIPFLGLQKKGKARVISGKDGANLYWFFGDSEWSQFGTSVSSAGDVNADGYADVIVGAPGDFDNGWKSGSARVFSGVDGSLLYVFKGDSAYSHLGRSVGGAGDVNGDGFDDLIVGVQGGGPPGPLGSARVFSGVDGSILYTFSAESVGDRLGHSVSGAGDVNRDGFDDLIVGAYTDDNNGGSSGRASVFSGLDGTALYTFHGDSAGDWFGWSVSGAGDVNGDGHSDLIVGAIRDDNNGKDSGSARVFSGCDVLGTSYCTPAVPNSSGQSAVMSACGSDLADGGYFMLHATDLPPGQFGYFLASGTQGFVANPGGSQGTLCLGGQVARFRKQIQDSGSDGQFTIGVDLTNIPTTPPHTVFAGETWNFQAWFHDLNPGPTSNFTDAVSVLFH